LVGRENPTCAPYRRVAYSWGKGSRAWCFGKAVEATVPIDDAVRTGEAQVALRSLAFELGIRYLVAIGDSPHGDQPAMDLRLTKDEAAFQREVRRWLRLNIPRRERNAEPAEFGDPKRIAVLKDWQRKLYAAGYLAMGWPIQYGGQAE